MPQLAGLSYNKDYMKKVDYQTLRLELDQILENLGQDEPDIEQAIKQYERGIQLVKMCEEYVSDARNRVVALKQQLDN